MVNVVADSRVNKQTTVCQGLLDDFHAIWLAASKNLVMGIFI